MTDIPPMRSTEKERPDSKRKTRKAWCPGPQKKGFQEGSVRGADSSRGEGLLLVLGSGVSSGDLESKQFQGHAGAWLSIAEARAGRGDCSMFQESQHKGRWRAQVSTLEIMRQQPPTFPGPLCPIPISITSLLLVKEAAPPSRKMYKL